MTEVSESSFFELVHQMMTPPENGDASDRRIKRRNNFPAVQLVAPYLGDQLPTREQLAEVQCRDLSTTGLSYFAPQPPGSDRVVVALATAFSVVYLSAAVAHCSSVGTSDKPMYLVGCRFLGRVHL